MLKPHTLNRILVTFTTTTTTTTTTSTCFLPYVKFCTAATSHPHSFTVSYLITNCGFSPEAASKATKRLRFETPHKPDSVFTFFTDHGFSHSQTRGIIKKQVRLLSCDPHKVILPKFQFLLSKGASTSDIVRMVCVSPKFLTRSLENHLIPAYEFVRGFLQSDKQAIACLNRNSVFFSDSRVIENARMLLDHGVTRSSIGMFLRTWPSVLCSGDLLKTVEELKEMGFNPSTKTFGVALLAKRTVTKTKWDEKMDTFKRWGWSREEILEAFRKQPYCMLSSSEKIDAVMSFWVNELGLKSLDLVRAPLLFPLNLHKRVIPRASVLRFLISKGLRGEYASLNTPFSVSEQVFLEKYVKCFGKESSHLLKLYKEKMNLANDREKSLMQPSPSV